MGDDKDDSLGSSSINNRDRKHHRHHRSRSRHSKKKRKSSSLSSSSESDYFSDDYYSRKKKRHSHRDKKVKKNKKRKKNDKKSNRHYSDDDDDSSSLSNDYKKRRKHRHSSDKKEKKKKAKKEKKDKRRKDADVSLKNDEEKALEKNLVFANALKELFTSYSDLAMELPYIFIQLGQGRSIDLKQMTIGKTPNCDKKNNDNVQILLSKVFSSLTSFGIEYNGDTWSWINYKPPQQQHPQHMATKSAPELILLRISRILLDEIGITHQAVEQYDQNQSSNKGEKLVTTADKDSEDTNVSSNDIQHLTKLLLQKFTTNDDPKTNSNEKNEETSIAKGLASMCQMIREDEIIGIDNIPDEDLRKALEKLFLMIGLVKEEMDPDDDDENHDQEQKEKEPPSFGFVIPDNDVNEINNIVHQQLNIIIDTCVQFKRNHQQQQHFKSDSRDESSKKRIFGPSLPPPSSLLTPVPDQSSLKDDDLLFVDKKKSVPFKEENEDDEELGPSPFTNSSRVRRIPTNMNTSKRNISKEEQDEGAVKREEWMMVPGEHDFLKGVISSGGLRSRTFQNKKSSHNIAKEVEILDPQLQEEVNTIRQAYADSRGPSLIDQHRQQKREAEEARKKNNENDKEFSWSRETDLDKGRRVDKNALHMVLGGASDGLKEKFQGSFSSGYT